MTICGYLVSDEGEYIRCTGMYSGSLSTGSPAGRLAHLKRASWLNVQSGHSEVGVIPIGNYVRRDNSDQPMLGDFVGALKSVASESPYCLPKTPIGTS